MTLRRCAFVRICARGPKYAASSNYAGREVSKDDVFLTVEHRACVVEEEIASNEKVEAFARHLHATIVRSPTVVERWVHHPEGKDAKAVHSDADHEIAEQAIHGPLLVEHPQLRKERNAADNLVETAEVASPER